MPKAIKRELSKLSKVPHPNGRKTAQLTKKALKFEHKKKVKLAHTMKTNVAAEKYIWFQKELEDHVTCSPEILMKAIQRYLSRFDDELDQISLKHEIGGKRNRQHANREDIIKITKANELEEFNTCGIELPDVMNPKQFQLLKSWNGELRFLQNFKLARFNKIKLQNLINSSSSAPPMTDVDSTNPNDACMLIDKE